MFNDCKVHCSFHIFPDKYVKVVHFLPDRIQGHKPIISVVNPGLCFSGQTFQSKIFSDRAGLFWTEIFSVRAGPFSYRNGPFTLKKGVLNNVLKKVTMTLYQYIVLKNVC